MKRKAVIHVQGHKVKVHAVSKKVRDSVKHVEQALASVRKK